MINKKIAFIVVFLIFLLAGFSTYFILSGKTGQNLLSPLSNYKPPTNNSTGGTTVDNEPKTEPCPINGALYSKTQKNKWDGRRPLAVMIENHPDARPQSGMSSADVIFEAVAEGGITRFLNIFYCQDAPFIGPVRSARIYFVKLAQGFGNNPLYAHVGGANTPGPADALGYLSDIGWSSNNDLNQFSVPFPYFWRDYERLPNRATEHTVYSSTDKLWQYAKANRGLTNVDDKGVSWDKNYIPWKFKDDAKVADRGTATKIDFGFWDNLASDFRVVWTYDKANNIYMREDGGAPQIDKDNNKQLSAKNVIVMFAKESPANDGYPGGHLLYGVIGSGDALIFQDGNAIKGTWEKKTAEDQVRFYDENGKEVSLVRGQIFVEILPIGNKVNY
ncbi:DUF3048 domain-containing protein [Patescibacteria group bacterium]|nr:DUF3048 domain-containing protein [Patescibacteria group bacterium]